jgi:hypothetical protein
MKVKSHEHFWQLMQWHRAFAWLPTSVDGRLIWLSSYERRVISNLDGYWWEYRSASTTACPCS